MFPRRALALSAIAIATALAGNYAKPAVSPTPTPAPADSVNVAGVEGITGKTQTVTMRQAIAMALQDNIDILWHKSDLRLQDASVRLAWGDFDPALEFSSTYTYSRTPENPTIISSADTAQQILLEQEAIAEIEAAAAPTPVPLPSTNATSTPTPAPSVSTQPYIFQNEDFRNTLDVTGKLPIGTTYKIGTEVDHLSDTVLGINQSFLPSNAFFAGISLTQPLLQGAGYDANMAGIRIGRKNRQVGYNNWKQRVIDSVGDVMATYFDMSYAKELMQLRKESIEADSALGDANQHRVDVGLMTPLDVSQAQAEGSADQYDYLTAKNLLVARVADLKKLVYRGVEQDDGRTFLPANEVILPVPILDRDTLLADAYQNRVDYATAIQQAQIEEVRLKYYRNQVLPRVDVVSTLGLNGLSTDNTGNSVSSAFNGQGPEWMIGIQGSIPLGNVEGRANLATSRRLKEEAIWKLKQVELAINTDVDTAISAIHTNVQRVVTARQAQKLAEDVVRMQTGRLEEGQASTLDVIDNRRRLYDAQSSVLEAVDDLNKSIVQLYLATGTLLRQQAIALDDDDPDAAKPRGAGQPWWPPFRGN